MKIPYITVPALKRKASPSLLSKGKRPCSQKESVPVPARKRKASLLAKGKRPCSQKESVPVPARKRKASCSQKESVPAVILSICCVPAPTKTITGFVLQPSGLDSKKISTPNDQNEPPLDDTLDVLRTAVVSGPRLRAQRSKIIIQTVSLSLSVTAANERASETRMHILVTELDIRGRECVRDLRATQHTADENQRGKGTQDRVIMSINPSFSNHSHIEPCLKDSDSSDPNHNMSSPRLP
ncbi:hypothetical protein BDR07DRAFT_1384585 [Suillus spraguei]|nr:hypothetical protein BDR07DRAFT_1384585 [Suillus spraguei]